MARESSNELVVLDELGPWTDLAARAVHEHPLRSIWRLGPYMVTQGAQTTGDEKTLGKAARISRTIQDGAMADLIAETCASPSTSWCSRSFRSSPGGPHGGLEAEGCKAKTRSVYAVLL